MIRCCGQTNGCRKRKHQVASQSLSTDWILRMVWLINWFFDSLVFLFVALVLCKSSASTWMFFSSQLICLNIPLFWVCRLHAVRSMICRMRCCAELDNQKYKYTWVNRERKKESVCVYFDFGIKRRMTIIAGYENVRCAKQQIDTVRPTDRMRENNHLHWMLWLMRTINRLDIRIVQTTETSVSHRTSGSLFRFVSAI